MAEKKNLENLRSGRIMTKAIVSSRKECFDILMYMTSLLPFPDEAIKALVHNVNSWKVSNIENMWERIDIRSRFAKKVAKLVYKLGKYNQLLNKAQFLLERYSHPSEGFSSIFKQSTMAWVYSVKDLMNKFNKLRNDIIPAILTQLNNTGGNVEGMWDLQKTQSYMRVMKGTVKERQVQTQQQVKPIFIQEQPMQFRKITRNQFLKNYLPTSLNYFLPKLKNDPSTAYKEIVGDTALVVAAQDTSKGPYVMPQIKKSM